jgi:hypothetical protein
MYPILVWYKKMVTDRGGGEVDGKYYFERNFGPWFKSPPGYFFLAKFSCN